MLGSVDKEKAEGLEDRTKGPRFAPGLECLGLMSRLAGLLFSPTRLAWGPRGGEGRFGLTSLQGSNNNQQYSLAY